MFSGAVETGQKRFILTGVEVEKGAEAQVAGSVWSGSCWGVGVSICCICFLMEISQDTPTA